MPRMKAKGPKLHKKGKTAGTIAEVDFKYMYQKPEGDVGFDPLHNQRVVERTIKLTKAREAKLKKEYMNKVEERVDAGVYFLKALAKGKYASSDPHTQAMKYFGRQELARLRGEEIKQELMAKIAMSTKLMNN